MGQGTARALTIAGALLLILGIFAFEGIVELVFAVLGAALFGAGLRGIRQADDRRSGGRRWLIPLIALGAIGLLVVVGLLLSDSGPDLEAVCQGVPAESAVALATGEPPFPVFVRTGSESSYDEYTEAGLPSEWLWISGEPAQLVLCLDRVETVSSGVLCPFESEGQKWEVQPFSVQYTATLREAQTASVLDTADLFAESEGCPFFSVFQEGDETPVPRYSTDIQGLESFLQPHVLP